MCHDLAVALVLSFTCKIKMELGQMYRNRKWDYLAQFSPHDCCCMTALNTYYCWTFDASISQHPVTETDNNTCRANNNVIQRIPLISKRFNKAKIICWWAVDRLTMAWMLYGSRGKSVQASETVQPSKKRKLTEMEKMMRSWWKDRQ